MDNSVRPKPELTWCKHLSRLHSVLIFIFCDTLNFSLSKCKTIHAAIPGVSAEYNLLLSKLI